MALLTLLAIGVDPTIQQTIDYRTRDHQVAHDAELPRAQSFTQLDDGISDQAIAGLQPPAALTGLVYNGIFFNSSEPGRASLDVVPTCSTGNCEFPRFESLAACSSCRNLTDDLEKRCLVNLKLGNDTTLTSCMFSLPNGLSINLTTQISGEDRFAFPDYEGQTIAASALLPLVDATQYGGDVRTHSVTNTSRSFVANLDPRGGSFLNITSLNGTSKGDQMTASATQCSLYWCVNTYEASVVNGTFGEKIVSSWRNESARWDLDDNFFPRSRPFDDRPLILEPPDSDSLRKSSPFVVFYQPMEVFWEWIAPKFTFSDSRAITADGKPNDSPLAEYQGTGNTFDFRSGRALWELAPWLDLRRNLRMLGLEEVVTNVAKAITVYLRTVNVDEQLQAPTRIVYDIRGAEKIMGTAFKPEVYIHIRWAWMAFLGSIIVLTIAAYILTVVQSARHGVAVWKSSPLALLFHGVESEGAVPEDLNTILLMERRAKTMSVKLSGTENGAMLEVQ